MILTKAESALDTRIIMKRYNLYRGGMHENPTGRWVEYADVVEQRFAPDTPDLRVAALVQAAKELRDAMAAAMRVLVHYEDGAWCLEQELAKAGIETGFGKRIDATLAAMGGEGR